MTITEEGRFEMIKEAAEGYGLKLIANNYVLLDKEGKPVIGGSLADMGLYVKGIGMGYHLASKEIDEEKENSDA